MKNRAYLLHIIILLIFSFHQTFGQEIIGRVVAISDGDNFTLLTANKE